LAALATALDTCSAAIGVGRQILQAFVVLVSVGPGCVSAQVDADTLEMLRTINAGSLPGVKEVAVRGACAIGHVAGSG
jgi:ornithine cyclodeaminase/alanine dehydrogenase-like protein (mu-crystallin family)